MSLALIGDRVSPSMPHLYRALHGDRFPGPVLSAGFGGLLVQCVSWRMIFGVLAAIALIVYSMFLRLHHSSPRKPPSNFLQELVFRRFIAEGPVGLSAVLCDRIFALRDLWFCQRLSSAGGKARSFAGRRCVGPFGFASFGRRLVYGAESPEGQAGGGPP